MNKPYMKKMSLGDWKCYYPSASDRDIYIASAFDFCPFVAYTKLMAQAGWIRKVEADRAAITTE